MNSVFKKGCRLEDAMHEEFEVFLFILWLNRNEKYYETAFIFHQSQTSLLNIFLAEEGLWMRVSWIFPLLVWLITPSYDPQPCQYTVCISSKSITEWKCRCLCHTVEHTKKISMWVESWHDRFSIQPNNGDWPTPQKDDGSWWYYYFFLEGVFSASSSRTYIYIWFFGRFTRIVCVHTAQCTFL